MYEVKWIWIDGSEDTFIVDTKKHAEEMTARCYRNADIVSVEIIELNR